MTSARRQALRASSGRAIDIIDGGRQMVTAAYLDWNATGKLRPQAQSAVLAALAVTGNPSSVHAAGREARHFIERARTQVAALAGVAARDVVFTSGGTEANMLALSPALGDTLLVSAIEHPSERLSGCCLGASVLWSRSCSPTTKPE
jgi:cysteine desulfurase